MHQLFRRVSIGIVALALLLALYFLISRDWDVKTEKSATRPFSADFNDDAKSGIEKNARSDAAKSMNSQDATKGNIITVPPTSEQQRAVTDMHGPKTTDQLAARLIQILAPVAATASDWKSAKVSKGSLGESHIPYWVLTNMRPILEADTNTTAFHVRATSRRDGEDKIVTTVWSNKFASTLEVDWALGSVNRKDRITDKGHTFDETHPDQQGTNNSGLGYTSTTNPRIVMYGWKDGSEFSKIVPFDHTRYFTVNGFISNAYPVAAMPLLPMDRKSVFSILLLDVNSAKIVGEVKFPAEAKSGRPTFILDQKNDVLLAAQFRLDWMLAIDLRPYVKKTNGEENQSTIPEVKP